MSVEESATTFFSSLSQDNDFNSENLDLNLIEICEDVEKNLIEDKIIDSLYNPTYDEALYSICEKLDLTEIVKKDNKSNYNITNTADEILFNICVDVEKLFDSTFEIETGVKRESFGNSIESPSKYRRLGESSKTCMISNNTSIAVQETITSCPSTLPTLSRIYKSYPGARSLLKSAWLKKDISTSARNINETLSRISEECLRQYDAHFKKWFHFCARYNLNYYEASVDKVLYFLNKLFYDGDQFDKLCTCRSALALLDKSNLCQEEKIQKLFKDIYRFGSRVPKNSSNTTTILNFVGIFYPYKNIPLEIITQKLITLLALSTARSVHDIQQLTVDHIDILSNNKILIKFPDQETKGISKSLLILYYVQDRPELCPGKALEAYLERTRNLRNGEKRIFISLNKPHKAVTAKTLSRWIKEILTKSGVDSSLFSKIRR